MTRTLLHFGLAAAMLTLLSTGMPAAGDNGEAPGTLEIELGLLWWESEFDLGREGDRLQEEDAGDLGFRGELWLPQHVGFVAQYVRAATGDLTQTAGGAPVLLADDVTYASLDVMYRLDTISRNNYLALGAGWEVADVAVSGRFGETSGYRLILASRFGTKKAYTYGEYAYMPDMDDMEPGIAGLPELTEVEGAEYELGIGYVFADHVQARVGYRRTKFHMVDGDGLRRRSVSWGYLAGLSFVF